MVKLTREEVYEATLDYFKGDSLAANVWIDKYALKDAEGNIYEKTPDDMHRRLAKEFARIEKKYPNPISEEDIYNLLKDFKYIVPQGSPMAGIGNNFVVTSLSNCFVIPSAIDSYGGIMLADQQQVQLMKRRGGVGHDLSNLRPQGTLANGSTLKGDTGMPLYMSRFSNSTREVAQDGRRGALMLSASIKHPDIDRFIDMKLDTTKVTGANVSVKITDEFMNSVINSSSFRQQFPIDSETPIVTKDIDSLSLWKKIIYGAWKSAEPGVLFWDTILKESPARGYGIDYQELGTNPCGEIPLPAYDSCRLIAINLYSYVDHPFTDKARFNVYKFVDHVTIAQRLMDDLVDLEIEKLDVIIEKIKSDPEPYNIKEVELDLWVNIRKKAVEGRRTGLGITGEGDMLAALGLTYGTTDATKMSEHVHKVLAKVSYSSSINMAKERGAFPIWEGEKDMSSLFLNRIYSNISHIDKSNWGRYGRRNIGNLTIAPTGTTSLMTQTTSGIEPVFMVAYKRRRKTEDPSKCVFKDEVGDMWEEYNVFHPKFKVWFEVNKMGEFGIDKKELSDFTDSELEEIIKLSPYHKATSADVDHFEKINMQGAIQKWVDHSISMTTNVPKETTQETVDQIYRLAWKVGCKGATIYRDGSRSGVLVTNTPEINEEIIYVNAPKRPKTLQVDIYTKKVLGKDWTVLVGLMQGKPYEIFAMHKFESVDFPETIDKGTLTKVGKQKYRLKGVHKGKEYVVDNIISSMSEDEQFQTRDFSRSLRHGEHPKYICDDIDKSSYISSFRKVISRVLKNYLTNEDVSDACPSCSSKLTFESGCKTCKECGWSACG